MSVVPLHSTHVAGVISIQALSPQIAQWNPEQYVKLRRVGYVGWVFLGGKGDHGVFGFIVVRLVVTDIEILNFAVAPAVRRSGVGQALWQEARSWGESRGATKAILEVRASNAPALRFYERNNFREVGRRSRYYSSPTDDALLLSADLKPRPDPSFDQT